MEVLKAHTTTYIGQYYSLAEKDREWFVKENPLEHILQCVEKEFNNNNSKNK